MSFSFKDIPKFLINLERRTDRLESAKKEFEYMGWSFERFDAVDTHSYEGCAYSHQKIANIIIERGYDYAMVFEDDLFFMPYIKELIPQLEKELSEVEWSFFHLAPSVHRPLNKFSENLVDLTNLPEKDPDRHRGIYSTAGFIISKEMCHIVKEWDTNNIIENYHKQIPIDVFFEKTIYPNHQSFAAKYPLVTQNMGYSDINRTYDSNHYMMTYNWNLYTEFKLESKYLDIQNCIKIKENEKS